jgi:hypothetical protein
MCSLFYYEFTVMVENDLMDHKIAPCNHSCSKFFRVN